MYYGFDTRDENAAVGALIVYAIWRSRDKRRFKIDTEVWGRVERFVKSCAKRAVDLGGFIERLKAKMECPTINPRYCSAGAKVLTMIEGPSGELISRSGDNSRTFLMDILAVADETAVLKTLYEKTALVILLVRDRLEREKPYEAEITKIAEDDIIDGEVIEG